MFKKLADNRDRGSLAAQFRRKRFPLQMAIVESIQLLGKNEFITLLPKAALYEEKIFGMTKSFVAYESWNE